jgi:thiol-disulfide isomerase/thioredoxin
MNRGSLYKTIGTMKSEEDKIPEDPSIVIDIMDNDHKNIATTVKPICVVYLYGTWCTPCASVAPKYFELASNMLDDTCIFIKENVDLGLSQVEAVPAFQIWNEGKLLKLVYGGNLNEIKNIILNLKLKYGSFQ